MRVVRMLIIRQTQSCLHLGPPQLAQTHHNLLTGTEMNQNEHHTIE